MRTRHGAADVPQVVASAKRIFPRGRVQNVNALAVVNNSAQDAINVLSTALWIFAGVVALSGVVAVTIVLTREVTLASAEQPTLLALGLSRRQRAAIRGYPALLIAGCGGVIAVVGAIAASPKFPFGVARRADPSVGVHTDWVVLVAGVAAVVLLVGSIAIIAAWRSTRRSALDLDARHRRPSRIVEHAARAGLAPTTTTACEWRSRPDAAARQSRSGPRISAQCRASPD